jgi:glycosyl hydrolase family 25
VTIFGYDVSSYQAGFDVAHASGDFAIIKCTQGNSYADPDYAGFVAGARASGKAVVAYHFLVAGVSPQLQTAWLASHIVDKSLPVMLDVEVTGTSRPGIGDVLQTIDTMAGAGLRVRLVYLPHWYWVQLGSPSLEGLTARHVGLVASQYPGGATYPGDEHWPAPYGGMDPMLWQFTDAPVDNNAYRGTSEELRNFLEGTEMNLTDTVTVSGGFAARYPTTGPDGFTAGAAISVATLLEGAAIRAANNEHLLQQVLAKVGAPVPVDVAALAKALAPELPNDLVDPLAVANAVVAHLGLEVVAK